MSEELKPFWSRHPYLVKPAAFFLLVLSPIVLPVLLVIEHWDGDVADYFNECIRALKKKEPRHE